MKNKGFTFIDLFAGIGGFHQALKALGGECVAASEINQDAINVYKENFPNTKIFGDIKKEWENLPKFDVLAGGFPCQPFSRAGKQKGFDDEKDGPLFNYIIEILKAHPECKFIILENVKNLADKSENWEVITKELSELNFYITEEPLILSPSQFGIPQLRERVFILGIRKDIRDKSKLRNGYIHMEELGDFNNLPGPRNGCQPGCAQKILEKNFPDECLLKQEEEDILKAWLEFKRITEFKKPGVPIWLDFFGYRMSEKRFRETKFNHIIKVDNKQKRTKALISEMDEWKQHFINKNRTFYLENKKVIDPWIKKYNMMNKKLIYKKFEWNCGDNPEITDYKKTIIQFRQSGIRVKLDNYFPTLVAINNTPIIYDRAKDVLRKISPREAANLQSFKQNFILPDNFTSIYKQLGNAVNVQIVERVFEKLMGFAKEDWRLR